MSEPRGESPSSPAAHRLSAALSRRLDVMSNVSRFLKIVWNTHRLLMLAMVVLRLLRGLAPVASLWTAKLIVDGVLAARAVGGGWHSVTALVALELAIVATSDLLSRSAGLVEAILTDLVAQNISVRLMEHAADLDLAMFEDPVFADQLERARQTAGRPQLMARLLSLVQNSVTLASLTAALLALNPWLLLLLLAAAAPSAVSETRFASLQYSLMFRWTPARRELDYLRYVAASPQTAKEVKVFGLAPWLVQRYRMLSAQWLRENRALAYRHLSIGWALSTLSLIAYYIAFVFIVIQAVAGAITLGALTFMASAFSRCRELIHNLLGVASSLYADSLSARDMFAVLELKPTIVAKRTAVAVPRPIREGVVFESVSFTYPGATRLALENVTFRIGAGERVALVGGNGAGKSTVVKLLARLYDPSNGRILLDGRDIRDYDVASLRRRVGIVFQDFVHYDMLFDENIGIGDVDRLRAYLDRIDRKADARHDRVPSTLRLNEDIVAAAERSQATAIVARLPNGWHQMLGRRFQGGVELSGGEWQKVALARAYMRDAELLVLDEPTHSLDARAEADAFERFAELSASRTSLLISHRFSTVRLADRIVVLSDGHTVDDGTHEQLLCREGLYNELFTLQSAAYR